MAAYPTNSVFREQFANRRVCVARLICGAAALAVCLACLSFCVRQARGQSAAPADERDRELAAALLAETESAGDIWLAQMQPGDDVAPPRAPRQTAPPSRTTPPSRTPPAQQRSVYRLASVPNMFGDFYGGSTFTAAFQPAPFVVDQVWSDGAPFDLFVINPGGLGASMNPADQISILNGPSGAVLAVSIAPGVDGTTDGQPDTYQISEPAGSAPVTGIPGAVVYNGGVAIFVGAPGRADLTQPANGSVNMPDGWNLIFSHLITPDAMQVAVGNGGGAAVRRIKLAENNSPEPRDRVFFNYHFFSDVWGGLGDVNRYTAGVEKTFFDEMTSLELRLPFASTLDSDQVLGAPNYSNSEFGDLGVVLKGLLYTDGAFLCSGGLGISVPTADDARLTLPASGATLLHIDNSAVHLLPFFAAMAHRNRFFAQAFFQLDIDANGNPVSGDITGANPTQFGVLQDATLLFVDLGLGYLVYDNPGGSPVSSISAVAEAHYSTPLQDADTAVGNGFVLRGFNNRFDVVNAVFGANIVLHDRIHVRPAMVVPLRADDNRQFDYEANVQVNVEY